MKIQTIVMIILMIFGASHSWAADSQEADVAMIKNVSGNVVINRGEETIAASPGMHLQVTDTVVSGAESSSGIVFTDGTLLSMGPSSEIIVENYVFEPDAEQYDFSLYLKKGRAVYSSGKIGKLAPDKIEIKTPRTTLGVRGTKFIVDVD